MLTCISNKAQTMSSKQTTTTTSTTTTTHAPPPPIYRILSLDGGGVRGIATMEFLQLMQRGLQLVDPTFSLGENFDMFAGTSVGGIIAVGLGVCEKSVDEISKYICGGALRQIFNKSCWDKLLGQIQTIPKYDGTAKSKLLENSLGGVKFSAGRKLVLIPVFDLGNKSEGRNPRTQFFVNHIHRDKIPEHHIPYAWEVANATSAAPTYFPPVTIKGAATRLQKCSSLLNGDGDGDGEHCAIAASEATFMDGGISINNPSAAAAAMAMRILRDVNSKSESPHQPLPCIKVLSVGTGDITLPIDTDKARNWGTVQWLNHGLLDLMLDTTVMDEMCEVMLTRENYLRVNSGLESFGVSDEMDNTSDENIQALRALGKAWWVTNCRDVFKFFGYAFIPEAEHVTSDE